MGKINRMFLSLVYIFFSSVLCFAGIPSWLKNPQKVFPHERYISALGEGFTKDAARKASLAELASYFEQRVESYVEASYSAANRNDAFSKEEKIERSVYARTMARLSLVRYTECHYNKKEGLYAVCAYIDRDEAWKMLSQKMDVMLESFEPSYISVQGEGERLRKIILINNLLSILSDFEDLYYTALVIYPDRCTPYTQTAIKLERLKSEVAALKLNVRISVTVTRDFNEGIKSKLEAILSQEGFTMAEAGESDYKLKAEVSFNERETKGVFFANPRISLKIDNGNQTICSFARSIGEVSSYNPQTLERVAAARLEGLLDESFLAECLR